MSIATIIMIVTFIMLFVAGGRIKHLFGIILPSLFTLAIFLYLVQIIEEKEC